MKPWEMIPLLCLFTGLTLAAKTLPEKQDFAWGQELELSDSKPFYRLQLPLEIYTGVVRVDLGDLRVLNGLGDVVPQYLEIPAARQISSARVFEAKLFPLYATEDSDIEAILFQAPQKWQQDRITLTTRERITVQDEQLHGYILQLDPEGPAPARRLLLDWRVKSQGFVHRLKVEYSKDLVRWHVHNANAVIADLRYAGERLFKRAIPLGNLRANYLRLTPVKGSVPIELEAARVEYAGEEMETVLNSLAISHIEVGEKPGEYLFELPGPLPVTQIHIRPGEMNTFLRATVYSRVDLDRTWIKRGSGMIYKLTAEGELLQQTELKLRQARDKYWKLHVDASSGGFGTVLPQVELGWTPHELLFAARGGAPFTLVYGSAQVGAVGSNDLLLELDADQLHKLTSRSIQTGERYAISGREALVKKFEPDWKSWLLWGVLVLASLLLGWMAWSTLRQMRD